MQRDSSNTSELYPNLKILDLNYFDTIVLKDQVCYHTEINKQNSSRLLIQKLKQQIYIYVNS